MAISHELVEAATDPFPDSNPAYGQTDDDDIVWTVVTGGEIADMCEFNDDANIIPPGSTYMVQRTLVERRRRRLKNPCVPRGDHDPYFNSSPAARPMIRATGGGHHAGRQDPDRAEQDHRRPALQRGARRRARGR